MTRKSRIVAQSLIASLLATSALPAQADYTQQVIIEQQREECRRLGGRYEYPKCYLPERQSEPRPTRDSGSSCGLGCTLILGAAAIAAGRIAYCKANPDKC